MFDLHFLYRWLSAETGHEAMSETWTLRRLFSNTYIILLQELTKSVAKSDDFGKRKADLNLEQQL